MEKPSSVSQIFLYISRQASSLGRYVLEQLIFMLVGWIPPVVGIGIRSFVYRLILKMHGSAAIESKVRLRFASNITLNHGVYLDQNTYLHACDNGITIGANSIVMHGAVLHVYNLRTHEHAQIQMCGETEFRK